MISPRERENGTTAVELAFALPVLLLLIFGIVEIGRYYFVQHTLQFGTREGTRLALVGKTLQDKRGQSMSREESIITMIKMNVSPAMNPDEVSISIFPVGADYSDPQEWSGQTNAGAPGQYMRVRTRYTYRFITPLVGSLFPMNAAVLEAECTYRNELFS